MFQANGNRKKLGLAADKILSVTINHKRQGRSLYKDEGISSSRDYNGCTYIYAGNFGAPKYLEKNLNRNKGRNRRNTIIVGNVKPRFQQ